MHLSPSLIHHMSVKSACASSPSSNLELMAPLRVSKRHRVLTSHGIAAKDHGSQPSHPISSTLSKLYDCWSGTSTVPNIHRPPLPLNGQRLGAACTAATRHANHIIAPPYLTKSATSKSSSRRSYRPRTLGSHTLAQSLCAITRPSRASQPFPTIPASPTIPATSAGTPAPGMLKSATITALLRPSACRNKGGGG